MNDNRNPDNKSSHLRAALIWFIAWIFVASVLAHNFREIDGIPGLIGQVQDGNYSILALLLLSIFLLANALYQATLHRSNKNNTLNKP